MATDKKHIAVYLAPEVEQALIAFCKQKGLKSKKGFMYSAGVNAVLAAFFGIADIDNILQPSSNTPFEPSNIPSEPSNIPSSQPSTIPNDSSNIPITIPTNILSNIPSNIPPEVLAMEVMPGKSKA
jgi:hypothetical protein